MTYRDEKETLRARVAELEETLAEKDEVIERLTGRAPSRADAGDAIERSALIDAAKSVVLERELDYEITDEGFEAIAALLRPLTVSQVGRTLTAHGFSLACANGRTRITMSGNYRAMPLGAISGTVLIGGFSAFLTFAIAHDFFFRGLAEANILWMAPLLIGLTFPFARKLAQRGARRLEKELRAKLEAVLELAKRHAVAEVEPATRVRVEQAPSSEEHEEEFEAPAIVARRHAE